ncbi:uncharacterized protein NECHADRAFT_80018 [Fusarium vanettenii 77-13-4]|uniref:Uncharacterized protein n=1 Tax=Fusarium vanettenii (strain ATCC MYA-4622 / CBS 123669 / FGSC 9596 / NRRL 45880 / 77-13-4) TaxID=660122 RepID=C7Z0V1_FUSV7|nr:uncharacterized protein NECHADRAFT_80018 [Fusarium vanettenii 77-13-4]EEU42446.1 predicted protein [Fusarium vanettenii 77-13-4]
MAPDPAPPLPLAANRAALSNRISLLLASQSSVLKTMNLSKPTAPTTKRRTTIPENDNDDDLVRGSRPNEGVGYVPDKKDAQKLGNSKEERMLRGRLGRDGKVVKKGKVEESESEDDVGRSALGKRKRPRREVEPEPKPEQEPGKEGVEEKSVEVDGDVSMKDSEAKDEAQAVTPSDQGAKKRKKKNKKKKLKVKNAEEK